MAYGIVLTFEGVGETDYWSVNEKLGIARDSRTGYPAGMLVHTAGPTPTGWVVSEVWETKQAQEKFMAGQLGEALQVAGIPAPSQVIETDAVNLQQFF